MSTEPTELIDEMLSLLNNEITNTADLRKDSTISQWISSQLKNLIFDLEALKADLDSGFTLNEVGFFSNIDLQERLDEYRIQISNLKAQLRNIKGIV